jgi:hypothetical protein
MRAAVEKAGGDPTGLQVTGGLTVERTSDGAVDPAATVKTAYPGAAPLGDLAQCGP